MEPMEALISFYENGYCIQTMVNAFLDADIEGYGRERIKNLLRIYRRLRDSEEYESPTDIELEEDETEFPDGVHENSRVYNAYTCHYEEVVEAIISWYENGISISNIVKELKGDDIESYTATRVQNLIKIYKRLKKAGGYSNPTDVELEEGEAKPTKKQRRAKSEPKEECDSLDEGPDDEDLGAECEPEEIESVAEDPLPIFNELNNHVMMVAQHLTPALLVSGPGGIGKSYSVQQVLSKFGKEKKDFVIMKGKCTPSAMYSFLFKNYNKICVFDDCDSVLCDKEGISILKGALDSGRFREISWNSRGADMVDTFECENRGQVLEKLEKWSKKHGGKKGIPTQFQFEGSVIFISNMSRQEIVARDAALLTRCSVVDIHVTNDEVIERLGALLPNFQIFDARGKNIANGKMKAEVYRWISSPEFLEHPKMKGKNVDFRMFIKAYKARYAKIPRWKEMSFSC